MALWAGLIADHKEFEEESITEEEVIPQNNSWNSSAKTVGIDLGYGFVKILEGERELKFPSVVGVGGSLNFSSGLSIKSNPLDNLAIDIDKKTYFVGNMAVKHSEIASRSLDQNRVEDINTKVLLLTSLGLLTQWEKQDFNLVTGLPTGYYGGYKEDWNENLKGDYKLVLSDGKNKQEKSFTIKNSNIIPQPFGTLYDRLLNDFGKIEDQELSEMTVGVVDIGFKTTDLAVASEMDFVEKLSSSTTTALSNAYRIIANKLREGYKVDKENYQLDKIIEKGEIRLAGKKHDLSDLKTEVYSQVATKIATEIESQWDYRDLDIILLTGGGGQALSEFLLPQFSNMVLVNNPQFANVRGYQKLAKSLFND